MKCTIRVNFSTECEVYSEFFLPTKYVEAKKTSVDGSIVCDDKSCPDLTRNT